MWLQYTPEKYQKSHRRRHKAISFSQQRQLSAHLMTYKELYWNKVHHLRLYIFGRSNRSSNRAPADNADRFKCTTNRRGSALRVAPSFPLLTFSTFSFTIWTVESQSGLKLHFTLVCICVIISLLLTPSPHVLKTFKNNFNDGKNIFAQHSWVFPGRQKLGSLNYSHLLTTPEFFSVEVARRLCALATQAFNMNYQQCVEVCIRVRACAQGKS